MVASQSSSYLEGFTEFHPFSMQIMQNQLEFLDFTHYCFRIIILNSKNFPTINLFKPTDVEFGLLWMGWKGIRQDRSLGSKGEPMEGQDEGCGAII